MGEGYHNFHHEFPPDYRNGIEWYQVDFTKWHIAVFECAGLAYNLNRFRRSEIEKRRIQQALRKLKLKSQSLDWRRPLSELPIMEWNEYQDKVRQSQPLILINGVVHDVSHFLVDHPGGEVMIRTLLGKDATAVFNGAIYDHSNAARNLLFTMRVAVLRGGGEVEILED